MRSQPKLKSIMLVTVKHLKFAASKFYLFLWEYVSL